ncbi:GIY-YIG nuclease family protein [Sporolactobacillus sp. STSJ-5]|uniref:GIY-YIG nuclease family protein n=1 Tax=Sporolactobacillus sp. STSJ-5 TaxID=2965076 RepID=UPI00210593F4|nr:GIY-YIG nuclease family protein [Sporolactobacillus sp. STSJ-5]MCQ2011657.1 GIY-YIG nuclease family protein [Sporolactobacillus sp. STSJ-5]
MTSIEIKFQEAQQLLNSLMSSKVYNFSTLKPSQLKENLAVVYAIFTEQETLYVGRTKNLRRRLYTNHLHGNLSTARLKKYLINDARFSEINSLELAKEWIKSNCFFRFIEIVDSNSRGHIEGMIGYLLNSRYIEDEH